MASNMGVSDFDPAGIEAISRRLSEATPPEICRIGILNLKGWQFFCEPSRFDELATSVPAVERCSTAG